jgi:hypothetical protein
VADIVGDHVSTGFDAPVTYNPITGANTDGSPRRRQLRRHAGHHRHRRHAITAGGAAVAVSHGSVKLNGDGTLTFTPTAGFSGQTTYSYTVTSGGVTETATETIQVGANQAPRPPRQHRQRHRRHFGGRALGGSDVDGTIAGITITAGPSAAQGQLMYDADGNPARPTCPCRSIPC